MISIWNDRVRDGQGISGDNPATFRNGQVVAFLSNHRRGPYVGLVISCWEGTRKPRLATQPLSLKSAHTLRVVEMSHSEKEEGETFFTCGAFSQVHMLRPWKLMCILDVCSTREELDSTCVKITEGCLEWLEQAKSSKKWWPDPEPETSEEKKILPVLAGRKPKRKRRFNFGKKSKDKKSSAGALQDKKSSAGAVQDSKAEKQTKKDHKGEKDKKKGKKKEEKQWQDSAHTKGQGAEIKFLPENFRKNDAGRRLIRQTMRRMFDLDMAAFKDRPLFDNMGLCRLQFDDCHGVKWSSMMEKAHEYFNLELPDSKKFLQTQPVFFQRIPKRS